MVRLVSILLAVLSATGAHGATGFTNLTQGDFDKITKEFSSNFAHPSVQGASSLGMIFGFEIGLVGGVNTSPNIDEIVKRSAPGNTLPSLYHAGIVGAVSVPFGFTGEVVYLPKIGGAEGSFQLMSFAGKFTMSEQLLPIIPFNLAARVFYTSSEFTFKQNVSGVDGTVANKNTVTGFQILASPKIPLVEPYLGIGFLKANNNLGITGTGTIFDTTLTTGQSAESSPTATQLLLGVNLKLLLFSVGLEYARAFESSRITGKLALAF